jgi:hypothetical protein
MLRIPHCIDRWISSTIYYKYNCKLFPVLMPTLPFLHTETVYWPDVSCSVAAWPRLFSNRHETMSKRETLGARQGWTDTVRCRLHDNCLLEVSQRSPHSFGRSNKSQVIYFQRSKFEQRISDCRNTKGNRKQTRKCKICGFHGGDYEERCLLECYAMWLL